MTALRFFQSLVSVPLVQPSCQVCTRSIVTARTSSNIQTLNNLDYIRKSHVHTRTSMKPLLASSSGTFSHRHTHIPSRPTCISSNHVHRLFSTKSDYSKSNSVSHRSYMQCNATWINAIQSARSLVRPPNALVTFKMLTQWRTYKTALMYMMHLMWAGHPLYSILKDCLFQRNGHAIRPVVILLVARAVHGSSTSVASSDVTGQQRKLAELSEMIFVASLIHNNIVDVSRSVDVSTLPPLAAPGNKISVLTGDLLLAKACVMLARLQNVRVVSVMSEAISQFSEGGSRQLYRVDSALPQPSTPVSSAPTTTLAKSNTREYSGLADRGSLVEGFVNDLYLRHGSLIAHSCKAVSILSGASADVEEKAFLYGKHLGIAYQLAQDQLNYTSGMMTESINALRHTAPVHLASLDYPNEICQSITQDGGSRSTFEEIHMCVENSGALQMTENLIRKHCALAKEAIWELSDSDARTALLKLTAGLEPVP